ncbi:MAG: hypothetical protein LRS48_03765 [Desulfurococcales archaeon]|nr:hypothetical protein [Desulfurococcales archaeon]
MGKYVPLYVNPSNLKVLVVGGGSVGTHRALLFAEAGAKVRVAALSFTPELEMAAQKHGIELVRVDISSSEGYEKVMSLVEDSDIIVLAAWIPSIIDKIAEYALKAGKLVNNAVDASRGNVVVPFHAQTSYGLKIAATSLGETGVAARIILSWMLERAESLEAKTLYEALSLYKRLLKACFDSPKERMPLYFLPENDETFWSHVRRGDVRAAVRRAAELCSESTGRDCFTCAQQVL